MYIYVYIFPLSLILQLQGRNKSINNSDHEIKMGISIIPPHQPQDKVPLRIHTTDLTCCRLQVRLDTTARDIVKEACQKLSLAERGYDLCEVKSSGEVVKVNDRDVSVHSGMSINGRMYIVAKSYAERTLVRMLRRGFHLSWGGVVLQDTHPPMVT